MTFDKTWVTTFENSQGDGVVPHLPESKRTPFLKLVFRCREAVLDSRMSVSKKGGMSEGCGGVYTVEVGGIHLSFYSRGWPNLARSALRFCLVSTTFVRGEELVRQCAAPQEWGEGGIRKRNKAARRNTMRKAPRHASSTISDSQGKHWWEPILFPCSSAFPLTRRHHMTGLHLSHWQYSSLTLCSSHL